MFSEWTTILLVVLCSIGVGHVVKQVTCDIALERQKAAIREELNDIRIRDRIVATDVAAIVAGGSASGDPVR